MVVVAVVGIIKVGSRDKSAGKEIDGSTRSENALNESLLLKAERDSTAWVNSQMKIKWQWQCYFFKKKKKQQGNDRVQYAVLAWRKDISF